MVWRALKWFKDAWSWTNIVLALLGFSGLAAFVVGAATAVGGAIWSIMMGIPLPIAVMVGFCVFVMAVYLAMAPLAYRALSQSGALSVAKPTAEESAIAAEAEKKRPAPIYAAWRHRELFTIGEAAKLWCDIDPHVSGTIASLAWVEAFKAAAQRGELDIETRWRDDRRMAAYESANPDEVTLITKASLRTFAKKHDHDPQFLRD